MSGRESYGCPDHPDHLVVFACEGDDVTIIEDCPECCPPRPKREHVKMPRTSGPDSRLRLAVRRHSCVHAMSFRAIAEAASIPRATLQRWMYAGGALHLCRAASLAEAVGCSIHIRQRDP